MAEAVVSAGKEHRDKCRIMNFEKARPKRIGNKVGTISTDPTTAGPWDNFDF